MLEGGACCAHLPSVRSRWYEFSALAGVLPPLFVRRVVVFSWSPVFVDRLLVARVRQAYPRSCCRYAEDGGWNGRAVGLLLVHRPVLRCSDLICLSGHRWSGQFMVVSLPQLRVCQSRLLIAVWGLDCLPETLREEVSRGMVPWSLVSWDQLPHSSAVKLLLDEGLRLFEGVASGDSLLLCHCVAAGADITAKSWLSHIGM